MTKFYCVEENCKKEVKGKNRRCKSCANIWKHKNISNYGFSGKTISEKHRQSIVEHQTNNNSFKGRHHSKKVKNKISNSLKGRNFSQEHCKKISETRKRLYREGKLKSNIHYCIKSKDTYPELEMEDMLIKCNIEYRKQFPILFLNESSKSRRRWYDFYLPEFNILIEVDGRYWHPTNNKNDIFKNNLAKKNNFKIVRVWADEIHKLWRIM